MKPRLVLWLRRLVTWLEGPDSTLDVVRVLMDQADALPGSPSGLYKHRHVLALLLKRFPGTRERDWNRRIEAVMQERD